MPINLGVDAWKRFGLGFEVHTGGIAVTDDWRTSLMFVRFDICGETHPIRRELAAAGLKWDAMNEEWYLYESVTAETVEAVAARMLERIQSLGLWSGDNVMVLGDYVRPREICNWIRAVWEAYRAPHPVGPILCGTEPGQELYLMEANHA